MKSPCQLLLVASSLLISGLSSVTNAAFVTPSTHTCRDFSECSLLPQHAPSRARGARSKVKGFKLGAAAKGASKKTKKTKKAASKKPEVENFKKSEFVTSIAEKTGFTKTDSEAALQAVLETIAEVSKVKN